MKSRNTDCSSDTLDEFEIHKYYWEWVLENPELGVIQEDLDCDGVLALEDCDDEDAPPPRQTCPRFHCKLLQ